MCYLILAGKQATVSGYVMGGHNDDLHGNTAAVYGIVPGKKHAKGEVARLPRPWFGIGNIKINEAGDLEIPQPPLTYGMFTLQTFRGYIAGDTSAVNEHQVAIAGGLSLAMDRNDKAEQADPVNKSGLAGGARYIALQRSRTARECVEILGSLLSKYGAVFPSCVGIMDPNEAWYFEIGGGTAWAAVRVPDDCYMVQSNGYRIGELDPEDKENVICSPNLLAFVQEKGLWQPEEGPFNWARAFGGKMLNDAEKEYYNIRRVWALINKYSPGLNLSADAKQFPLFLKAEQKFTVKSMIAGLRDHFDNTQYDAFPETGIKGLERPVCVPSCIHSAVIELHGNLPAGIGAVLWGCLGSPMSSPYIPHFLGHQELLPAYTKGTVEYDGESAFWRFRTLTNLLMYDYTRYLKMVSEHWVVLEQEIFAAKDEITQKAAKLYQHDPQAAGKLVTSFGNAYDALAYQQAKTMESVLHTDIADKQYLHFAKPGLEW